MTTQTSSPTPHTPAAGAAPSSAAVLVAEAVVFLTAPLVFIAGWALVKRALARADARPVGDPLRARPGPEAGVS